MLNKKDDECKFLSHIPEYLPLGLIVYDKEGYLKYANSTALVMFGATMEDVYGLNIFDDPNIGDQDKIHMRNGDNVSFETDYDFDRCRESFFDTSINNIKKHFVTKVTIMRDDAGNMQAFLLNCEDVTEKKVQEQKMVEVYKKIKAAQMELSLALNAGDLLSWNYVVSENVFYKFSENIDGGEPWAFESIMFRIHPDDRKRFLTLLNAVIKKVELAGNNFVLKALDEQFENYRHYSFVYRANEDENGDVTSITFIQHDITEDVKYQQNLISAKNKAEEADKLKSTFLATMSHEIRTPLNAIVGFSQLISETDDPAEKSEFKQMIETNSDILLKLIGDILDLSKIEAGSIDINRQKLDLSQLCQELYQSFQCNIKNPDITIRLIDPYTKCIANLDRHRFIQIFTNYLTNAIKYTAKGEIVMGYQCSPGQIRLYVKDNGIGIPEHKKCRIFHRFEKLDDFAQGTGLGLSICKAIADATGGKVGFESQVDKGSEFWYTAYTDVEYVEKSQFPGSDKTLETDQQNPDGVSAELSSLNILIAEDNDSNYLLMKNILKKHNLTRAITGVDAVEKTKNGNFNFIIMDMKMPVMNGIEATTIIREFNNTIPIIALTANAFHADKDLALAAGCDYFMTKPVKQAELIELIAKLRFS